jgi:putative toxin-antitoxin system antitoxin component (TIGR02293 family)
MLYYYGIEVFGGQERFNTWLTTKNTALGGIKPKDLLDSSFGIQMLKDELTRIEHGVLA